MQTAETRARAATFSLLERASIVSAHTGPFQQGQAGVTYTLTVSNAAGVSATAGAVTVTETLPAGLTLVSMAGTEWSCAAGANTCTRSDALAAGASYPPITVTANVGNTAGTPLSNSASVSGGASATATATDSTIITPNPAVLSVAKTHTGDFKQGQKGVTYTVTVSNKAGTTPTVGGVAVNETRGPYPGLHGR